MPVVRPRPRGRCRALAAVAVLALALSACSDDAAPGGGPAPSGSSGTPSPAGTPTAAEPTEVTLLEAGAASRRVVEIDLPEGHTESSTIMLRTTTAVDFMSSPPITVPLSIPLTTEVVEVTDDEVTVDVRYGKATVSGGGLQRELIEQARTAVGYLEGVTARVVRDRAGVVRSSEVEVGEDASDLVRRLLEDVDTQSHALTVPFPVEEVGVGARWRVTSAIGVGGAQTTVVSTYELTRLTPDAWTVSVRTESTAAPGDTLAGRVVDGSSTSTATIRGRTGLLGPVAATGSTTGDSTVEVGGQRVRTDFDVTLRASTRQD